MYIKKGMSFLKHGLFIKNAAVLTVTSLILRTLRIWMSNTVGAEGMGLYQLVVSVYVLVSAFATTGICTAVTRLTAELGARGLGSKKILSRGITLSLVISAVSVAAVYIGAEPISTYLIGDMRAVSSLKVLGLGIPFMGICSCLRGYFIAIRTAPSIGQIVEQLVRITVVVLAVTYFGARGIEYAVAAILLGDGIAEAAGCGLLYVLYIAEKKKSTYHETSGIPVTSKMLHIAVPITAGKYIHTALRTVENLLVPARISRFTGSKTKGLEQFGMLKGMVMPLLFFPASFLTAFSTLMIPEISEALERGNYRKVRNSTEKSIGITVIISTLIGGVFFLCGEEISQLLYNESDTGALVVALAPLVPFMYLECVCDGILKGLDQQGHSFVYGVIDSVTRIILIWAILPSSGMRGFIGIMVYSNLLTSLLNIRRLLKVTKTPVKLGSWIIRPALSVTVGTAVGKLAMSGATSLIGRLIFGGFSLSAVYLLMMFFMGELNIVDGLL